MFFDCRCCCCCRLSAAQTRSTVVPVAPRVIWKRKLVSLILVPCHGKWWLWKMWIVHLLAMCVRIRVHVMMMKPAVSWRQANMAAARYLRYCMFFPFCKWSVNYIVIILLICDATDCIILCDCCWVYLQGFGPDRNMSFLACTISM